MFIFLGFYYNRVIKSWWSIFIFIFAALPEASKIDSFYFDSKNTLYIQKIASDLSPWLYWIAGLVFLLANIRVIYKLWKEKEENKISLQDDKLPEKYVNITKKLDSLLPSKSIQIRENFSSGYRCLTELTRRDINTAICIHFSVYKEIRGFLIDFLRSDNVEITVKMSETKSKFESNYFQLEEYNNIVGQNKNQAINEHDVQKLIGDINDNLNSLFVYIS